MLHYKGDQALAQAAQGDCRVSIPGDVLMLSRHGPAQVAVGRPVCVMAGGPDNLQRSLSTSTIL